MYAKSFIALDGNGRLTGARTAQRYPYDRYTCHLCGSALRYHPEHHTERPYFEHRSDMLTDNGRQHCPYVRPDPEEARHTQQLQRYIPDVRPLIRKRQVTAACDSSPGIASLELRLI
ncbi:zinc-ribbon domain-containing protein [Klebsiella pneumoniae]|nr:zinc-ribbon domain-containing protein [Klebsiella pneumoniae]MBV0657898.1 zinc-ribbon domain-containing protein [Klebsiella pneumoniae]MBV0695446.1 zinc-ribbon domain-containing protein [Klebsiella pneumoniae]MBV0700729.1 zinc-ribbon domain-containing protein [Klebsiella pneumoniae]MBV0733077.1 zinc-ribbon domain-containing protein [Klebsiella pneumoniae]